MGTSNITFLSVCLEDHEEKYYLRTVVSRDVYAVEPLYKDTPEIRIPL